MAAAEVIEMTPKIELNPSVKRALNTASNAKAMVVSSISERSEAAEMGRAIAQLEKEITEFFKPMKDDAFRAHKTICAKENEVLQPLQEAKKHLSKQIGGFDQEQERIRREEEARIQEEERKRAEAESKRLSEEQALTDAIALEAEGDKAGAEAVLNNPVPVSVPVTPVIVERQVPKVAGVSTRERFQFRIVDAGKVGRDYCVPDEKKIRQLVNALGVKAAELVGGIEVWPERGASFRA